MNNPKMNKVIDRLYARNHININEGFIKDAKQLKNYCGEFEKFLYKSKFRNFDEIGVDNGKIFVEVSGDWKHEHLYFKQLAKEFFEKIKGREISMGEVVTREDGSDTYDANHYIAISESVNEGGSVNLQKLERELNTTLIKFMSSPSIGFNKKEAEEYSRINVKKEKDRISIEVGAEIDYDNLMGLADKLDSVISKYDSDAYFEADSPGLLSAYIYNLNENFNYMCEDTTLSSEEDADDIVSDTDSYNAFLDTLNNNASENVINRLKSMLKRFSDTPLDRVQMSSVEPMSGIDFLSNSNLVVFILNEGMSTDEDDNKGVVAVLTLPNGRVHLLDTEVCEGEDYYINTILYNMHQLEVISREIWVGNVNLK